MSIDTPRDLLSCRCGDGDGGCGELMCGRDMRDSGRDTATDACTAGGTSGKRYELRSLTAEPVDEVEMMDARRSSSRCSTL